MPTKVSLERAADAQDLGPNIKYAATLGLPMVQKDCHKGAKGFICSTGPSVMNKSAMRAFLRKIKDAQAQGCGVVIFALKEAIPFLRSKGVEVTYSSSMDPGGVRQVTRTPVDLDVTYCVASSCHPMLFDYLLAAGCRVQVFHSACGHGEPRYEPGVLFEAGTGHHGALSVIKGQQVHRTMLGDLEFCPLVCLKLGEVELYQELFGTGDTMQGGFTVTNRTLSLANYMGLEDIVMMGTDFGWRREGGSHYSPLVQVDPLGANAMSDEGQVDGTPWFTRVDQLASAVDVARKIKEGEVMVLGDSLAVALSKREDSFLDQVVYFGKG